MFAAFQVVTRGAADLNDALNFAAAIEAKHLCGVIYSALAKYPGPPTAQGRANCAREIRKLAAKAADKGIKVCLEVVNRWMLVGPVLWCLCLKRGWQVLHSVLDVVMLLHEVLEVCSV